MKKITSNKMLWIFAAIAAAVAIIYIFIPRSAITPEKGSGISEGQQQELDPVSEVKSGKAVLIDVRTREEWVEGHADGAIHFDVKRLEAGEMPNISKDKDVYLYCRSGNRAGLAKGIMIQNGFKNVENIGGINDWVTLGGALISCSTNC